MNLQDVFIIQNLTVLNEGKTGPLKIRGIFQRADEANNNQRIYPQRVLEGQVRALNEAIKERRLVGELDHPTYDMVKLSNASHLITGLHLEGKEVVGEAEILFFAVARLLRRGPLQQQVAGCGQRWQIVWKMVRLTFWIEIRLVYSRYSSIWV